jgi:hypothetical protein
MMGWENAPTPDDVKKSDRNIDAERMMERSMARCDPDAFLQALKMFLSRREK